MIEFILYESILIFSIGIDKYNSKSNDFPNLKGAKNDSLNKKKTFGSLFESESEINEWIILIDEEEATKEKILSKFEEHLKRLPKEERKLIIFHFSGHGYLQEKNNQKRYFLCALDFDVENPEVGGIDLFEIRKIVCTYQNFHCLALIDSCFSGSALDKIENFYSISLLENSFLNSFYVFFFC